MASGLLAGLRVVEMAHPLTEYAGLVWAGLGAEVWLVEPPGGALSRRRQPRVPDAGESPRGAVAFLVRNANKKSVVVDPDDPEHVSLLRGLCQRADMVFDADGSPFRALGVATLAPAAVTITNRQRLGTSSIVGFAASGGLASSGWPHQPPCNAPSWLALDGAGVYAAVMGMVALLAYRRGGGAVRYEVPYEEAAVASITPWTRTLHAYGMQAAGQGTLTARLGPDGFPIYQAKDGYVRVLAATPKQWRAFVDLLGRPDELVSGPWSEGRFRAENADALKLFCADLIRQRTVEELFAEGQRRGLTISPVYSLRRFRDDLHVRARQIFTSVEDPEFGAMEMLRAPVRLEPAELNAPVAPAPGLGEHDEQARAVLAKPASEPSTERDPGFDIDQPLAGLRILELGVGAVVPEAASLLALLGAEVVKVESLAHVDFLRRNGLAGTTDVNNSPTFNQLNLGVQSVAIDLSRAEGVGLLRQLAARCDIVMENMRGPIVRRWGLDYESARAIRPNVIYLGSQGLGCGPYDGYQTYGPNLQTFSGVTRQWSHPDDPFPVGTTLNHPDHIAGKQSLVALLGALLQRPSAGCFIDATQVETAAYLIGDCYLAQHFSEGDLEPLGNRSPDMAPHGCYPCAPDGEKQRWLALAVEDDDQWLRLRDMIGEAWADEPALRDLAGRLANAATLDDNLARWSVERSVAEVEGRLRDAGIPASRVVTGDDMAASEAPCSRRESFFPAVGHPTSGTRRYTAVPVLREGHRPATRRPPLLGEHTEQVLYDLLELPPEDVHCLMAEKIVGH